MDGELQHKVELVNYAKCKQRGIEPPTVSGHYIKSVSFVFAEKKLFRSNICTTIDEWINELHKRSLEDIKLVCRIGLKRLDISLSGFSNSSADGIITFYGDKTTMWQSHWEFNQAISAWNVKYTEQKIGYSDSPKFSDRTEQFIDILEQAGQLGRDLGNPHWAENCFDKAIDVLTNQDKLIGVLPEKNQKLLLAAEKAWVFGGMGSWNDDTAYAADSKGLKESYERLTSQLYDEIHLAIMYAVNEW